LGVSNDVRSTITYGVELPTEADLRLCGDVSTKRVVVLGDAARTPIAFARLGARTIAVDPSEEAVESGRQAADAAEVKIEFHVGDLADLGFVTSASVDLVFSTAASESDDLSRLVRQAHRVLREHGSLVLAVPHPARALTNVASLAKGYWANGHRTMSEYFTTLTRAAFTVDVLLEPEPSGGAMVPPVLVTRGRKVGS
jgi:SAM-dependent methyltransferase